MASNGKTGFSRFLELSALVFATLTGAGGVGLYVFKVGAVVDQVNNLDRRVAHIEASGSPPYSSFMKLEDERQAGIKDRLAKVEESVKAFNEMRVELAAVRVRLEDVNVRLEDLKNSLDASKSAHPGK